MESLLTLLLVIHIAAGFTSLITGTISLVVQKGGKNHLLNGRIFYYCMLVVAGTAVVLSVFRPNLFLLLIAFFGLYQNLNGMRAIRNKSLRPKTFDWVITLTGLITGIIMISQLNIVLLVFGGISTVLAIGDIKSHITVLSGRDIPRNSWLVRHIGMMMGSYIATCTAFVVVNVQFEPAPWLPWLAPAMIIVPLMVYFQRKYTGGKGKKINNEKLADS